MNFGLYNVFLPIRGGCVGWSGRLKSSLIMAAHARASRSRFGGWLFALSLPCLQSPWRLRTEQGNWPRNAELVTFINICGSVRFIRFWGLCLSCLRACWWLFFYYHFIIFFLMASLRFPLLFPPELSSSCFFLLFLLFFSFVDYVFSPLSSFPIFVFVFSYPLPYSFWFTLSYSSSSPSPSSSYSLLRPLPHYFSFSLSSSSSCPYILPRPHPLPPSPSSLLSSPSSTLSFSLVALLRPPLPSFVLFVSPSHSPFLLHSRRLARNNSFREHGQFWIN